MPGKLSSKQRLNFTFWAVSIFALQLLAYLPSLPAFLFSVDDSSLIEIPQIQTPFTLESIKSVFRIDANIDYYPVRDISYMIDAYFWPHSTTLARIHQLGIFEVSILFLPLILIELGVGFQFALITVGLWAIHPYHGEMVMWLSARKDVLALSTGIASAYFFILTSKGNSLKDALLSGCIFILSILSKSSLGLLPIVGLFAWLFGYLPSLKNRGKGLLIFLVSLGVISSLFQGWFYTYVNDMRNLVPISERFFTSLAALGRMSLGWINPALNIVDNDSFGEWLGLNQHKCIAGALIWISLFSSFGYGVMKRKKIFCFYSIALLLLYIPVSGLLFPHRSFYSTRYLEPASLLFFIFLISWISKNFHLENLAVHGWKWKAGLLLIASIIYSQTINEGQLWLDAVDIRERASLSEPESISLKSYLYGDVVNAIKEHSQPPEIFHLKDELEISLDSLCNEGTEITRMANCHIFFLRQYHSSVEKKDIEKSKYYFSLFRKAITLLRPTPSSLSRMEFENKLQSGSIQRSDLNDWHQSVKYKPNPEYRYLDILSFCLSNEADTARDLLKKEMHENLVFFNDFYAFFRQNLASSLKTQAY